MPFNPLKKIFQGGNKPPVQRIRHSGFRAALSPRSSLITRSVQNSAFRIQGLCDFSTALCLLQKQARYVNGHKSLRPVPRAFPKRYAETDFHHRLVIVPPNISSFNENVWARTAERCHPLTRSERINLPSPRENALVASHQGYLTVAPKPVTLRSWRGCLPVGFVIWSWQFHGGTCGPARTSGAAVAFAS